MAFSCLDCYRLQIYGPETIQLINLIINYGYCWVKTNRNSDKNNPIWRKHKLISNLVIQVDLEVITVFNLKCVCEHCAMICVWKSLGNSIEINSNSINHLTASQLLSMLWYVVNSWGNEVFYYQNRIILFFFLIKLSGNNKILYHSNHWRGLRFRHKIPHDVRKDFLLLPSEANNIGMLSQAVLLFPISLLQHSAARFELWSQWKSRKSAAPRARNAVRIAWCRNTQLKN